LLQNRNTPDEENIMGSILFAILRIFRVVDWPFDLAIFCMLLSIDTISLVLFIYLRRIIRKSGQ
jgi:hypothetical protein